MPKFTVAATEELLLPLRAISLMRQPEKMPTKRTPIRSLLVHY